MSGLTENEIRSKHVQALKEARDACQRLALNQDPEKAAPRGRHYKNLKKALGELEGSCRQMSMFRSDARWTKLGFVYARAMRTARSMMLKQNWVGFGKLAELFVIGLKRLEDLDTRKTGTMGPILPKRTDWLQLPDVKPHSSLWTPQGRLPN